MQLMQEYVQKSTRTTLPRSPAIVSGLELRQWSRLVKSGAAGPTGRPEIPDAGPLTVEPPLAPMSCRADWTWLVRSSVWSVFVQSGKAPVRSAESAVSAPTAINPAVARTRTPKARPAHAEAD